jgi:hypothetical protein
LNQPFTRRLVLSNSPSFGGGAVSIGTIGVVPVFAIQTGGGNSHGLSPA